MNGGRRRLAEAVDALRGAGRVDPGQSLGRQVDQLEAIARRVRRLSLCRAYATGAGHLGSELSATDILVALYCSVTAPARPAHGRDPHADRVILSKGHAAVALYGVLTAAGILDPSRLTADEDDADALPGHPASGLVPGADATTGSLGHGLSLGLGAALGARIDGARSRTWVVLGDGELQEGSNWEALMLAAHLRLGSLTAVIDANRLQQGSKVSEVNGIEPLRAKLEAFGWRCTDADGHDFRSLLPALTPPPDAAYRRPHAVIANTVKGSGVAFMAGRPEWHHRIPDEEELVRGLAELDD